MFTINRPAHDKCFIVNHKQIHAARHLETPINTRQCAGRLDRPYYLTTTSWEINQRTLFNVTTHEAQPQGPRST